MGQVNYLKGETVTTVFFPLFREMCQVFLFFLIREDNKQWDKDFVVWEKMHSLELHETRYYFWILQSNVIYLSTLQFLTLYSLLVDYLMEQDGFSFCLAASTRHYFYIHLV